MNVALAQLRAPRLIAICVPPLRVTAPEAQSAATLQAAGSSLKPLLLSALSQSAHG